MADTLTQESDTPLLDAVAKSKDGPVGEVVGFQAPDEAHQLWFEVQGDDVQVMVASTPTEARARLEQWKALIDVDLPVGVMPDIHQSARDILDEAIRVLEAIVAKKSVALQQKGPTAFVERSLASTVKDFNPATVIEQALKAAENDLDDLAYLLTDLYTLHFNVVHGDALQRGEFDPIAQATAFGQHIDACSPYSKDCPTTSTALLDGTTGIASFGTSIVANSVDERAQLATDRDALAKPGTKACTQRVKDEVRGSDTLDKAHKDLGSYESKHVARPVENCAEVEAIDRAMWMRDAMGIPEDQHLDQLTMATVQTSNKRPMAPCRNCEVMTSGMNFQSPPPRDRSSDEKKEGK